MREFAVSARKWECRPLSVLIWNINVSHFMMPLCGPPPNPYQSDTEKLTDHVSTSKLISQDKYNKLQELIAQSNSFL